MPHKIKITINDNKDRNVFFDEILSHQISETILTDIIKEAKDKLWESNPNAGTQIGQKLYDLLNGSSNALKKHLDISKAENTSLHIYLDLHADLHVLPFELLYSNDLEFLLLNTDTHIMRQVVERGNRANIQPKNRALRMLFMACSPEAPNINVLSFEGEEELIIKSIGKYPFDIEFEDTYVGLDL
jgi:hypothetical protein